MEYTELLPTLAENGMGVLCIGIFSYFIYMLFNKLMSNIEKALEDNKAQAQKFSDITEKFIDVVKEQDARIEAKLDRISDKIDNLNK